MLRSSLRLCVLGVAEQSFRIVSRGSTDCTRTALWLEEANLLRNRFSKWCSSSLKGHLILFQLLCATPLSLWAIFTMRSEGTLTVGSAIRMTLLSSLLCAIGAGLVWYIFSKPLIQSRSNK